MIILGHVFDSSAKLPGIPQRIRPSNEFVMGDFSGELQGTRLPGKNSRQDLDIFYEVRIEDNIILEHKCS